MNAALLLIDIQNDYFPGGAMELTGMTQAAAQAREADAGRESAAHPAFSERGIYNLKWAADDNGGSLWKSIDEIILMAGCAALSRPTP